jgi:RND family efflux transporter MFP subunit
MKKQPLIMLCASILLTTAVANDSFAAGQGRAGKASSQRSILVVTEQVGVHNISQSLTLVGKLQAEQSVIIAPEVSGKISAIAVQASQQVGEGQALVQLQDDKARAQLAEATAYLKDEQRKLTEFQKLAKRGAITQTEIDAQRASVDIATARLGSAEASLEDLTLRAPFGGTIGFIDFSRGKLVSAGESLLTLDNLSVMRLDLQIPERYLSMLSVGMAVDATSRAWGDSRFDGKVVGIDSRINDETLNLRVRIHFDNNQLKLKPGMLMSSHLAFPAIEAPIIPVQALQYSGTRRYVYVVDESNTAKRTEVSLGARVDNQVVIEKGLAIGERIVVQGIVNLRDGNKVKEQGQAAAEAKADKQSNKDKS